MKTTEPIRIMGGGLAGLSLGIALRRAGVPAEVFEAGAYPRHRVCGEFVTGLGQATIEKLGIERAFAGAGSHHSVTWFSRGRAVGRQTLPAPARAISRFALDARLAELFVASGGRLVTQARLDPPNGRAGWVDTGGRKPSKSSPWLALKAHARGLATTDGLELHLGDGAYVGLSAVEDGWVNICGLFRRRRGLRFNRAEALPACLRVSGLDALAGQVAEAEIRPGSASAVAGFVFDRRIRAGEGVRLGDACAMIPPFTGDGMAMAFTGAALAVDPLVSWARHECAWTLAERRIHKALHKEFRVRLSAAAILHPFLLGGALQRFLGGAASANILPLTPLYHLLH